MKSQDDKYKCILLINPIWMVKYSWEGVIYQYLDNDCACAERKLKGIAEVQAATTYLCLLICLYILKY